MTILESELERSKQELATEIALNEELTLDHKLYSMLADEELRTWEISPQVAKLRLKKLNLQITESSIRIDRLRQEAASLCVQVHSVTKPAGSMD